ESGFANPIDDAIREHCAFELGGVQKLDEVPYDFVRKRLSVLIATGTARTLVTKGAATSILEVCTSAEMADGSTIAIDAVRGQIEQQLRGFGAHGLRTLAVAYRDLGPQQQATREAEQSMCLLGFLLIFDPPKAGIAEVIDELRGLGIALKVISG